MVRTPALFGKDHRRKAVERSLKHEEIARVAYELYEERGRLDGYDVDDWLKAEGIVRQGLQAAPFIV